RRSSSRRSCSTAPRSGAQRQWCSPSSSHYSVGGGPGLPEIIALIVVVHRELVRMWPQANRIELLFPLVANPRLDQVGSEDVTLQQERVIGLERVDRLFERSGRGADAGVGHLAAGHLVDITIQWLAGVEAILD